VAVTIPYVKAGAPFIDDPSDPDATFAAAEANTIDDGLYIAHRMPCVYVYNSAGQSIPNNTVTALTFDSEMFDQAGGASAAHHSTGSNTSRLTALYDGIYQVSGGCQWATTSATGNRSMFLYKNGATVYDGHNVAGSTAVAVSNKISALVDLQTNDYVEIKVLQNSGGSLSTVLLNTWVQWFAMARAG
jgi:hypothetical protein